MIVTVPNLRQNTSLAIIVPYLNEHDVLALTCGLLCQVLDNLRRDGLISKGQIIFVDDGSVDNSWQMVQSFARDNALVTGIKLSHNVGHQNALWAGLECAYSRGFDATVTIDADMQDDTEAITEMLRLYHAGNDIVFGVRANRHTDTLFKRATAAAFYKTMRMLGGEIEYNHADFRLMSRRAMRALLQHTERNLFLRCMVKRLGFSQAKVYYKRKRRLAGHTKYSLGKMLHFTFEGVTSFSVKPLRLITSLGMVFMLISAALICYGLAKFVTGRVIPGWTSLMLSLWFIGGAILTALGIIGEYIGKIYNEVKSRPRYFIDETVGDSNTAYAASDGHDDAHSDVHGGKTPSGKV